MHGRITASIFFLPVTSRRRAERAAAKHRREPTDTQGRFAAVVCAISRT
jgi:hypothetical protein